MTTSLCKKSIATVLVGAFLLPATLFLQPIQADAAAANCAAVVAGAVASIAPLAAVEKVLGVTVSKPSGAVAGSISAGSSYGTFFKDCILTPLAIRLAKAMLQNITTGIVNWINNGFNGSPAFVQDLHGLITDTTDQAIGDFINHDLGAGFLCSSFSLQVKIAIAQSYMPYQQRAACTLSQITNNVNGFIRNDNSGGWGNWLQVTTEPQNNVYGATILAQNELSRTIADKLAIQNRTLDWGKGFRSWDVCDQYETQAEANARAGTGSPSVALSTKQSSFQNFDTGLQTIQFGKGSSINVANNPNLAFNQNISAPNMDIKTAGVTPQCLHYTTKTPGTSVEAMLETSLGSGIRQLEVANDIDAIMGALTNQLMSQVVTGAQGLLGAGKNSSGSYSTQSYQSALSGNISDPALADAIDSGIQQSTQDSNLNSLFTEASSSDASTTAATTDANSSAGTAVTPDTHLSILTQARTVTYSSPLSYDIELSTNVATSSIGVRTTLQKNGVPVAFLTPFDSFRVAYGAPDGVLAVKTIDVSTDASILWSPIPMAANTKLVFKFSANKSSSSRGQSAAPDEYTLETDLLGANGTVIQSQVSNFTIQ